MVDARSWTLNFTLEGIKKLIKKQKKQSAVFSNSEGKGVLQTPAIT